MKKILFFAMIAMLLYSCKSATYIPVETTKIDYRDNLVRDSVIRYDSVYLKDKGDTLILERYKYLYKNRIVKDSIFVNDTIRIPYPVEVVKPVKAALTSWQNFQIGCGRIALFALLFACIYFVWKLK
ncbi:hypothetical protein C0T31_11560 [Dysgonamonadaceae bacterium]|jgi:hypothetical protein|nr:hypothetical protein C0T31_11560 [Dysgonamonadaceae bacterium]